MSEAKTARPHPRATSVYERVRKATEKAGPVVQERTTELAAALLWLLDMAERLAEEDNRDG